MNKKFDFKKVLKTTLGITLALSFSFATANAAQTMAKLSGIEINPSQQGGYDILLDTDQNVTFEKTVQSDDNIEIELKGAEVLKPLNTIYNNSTNIDHVLFKPSGDGNVKILLKGKNIARSNVKLVTDILSNEVSKDSNNPENTVFLNRPINTYSPVVSENKEESTDGVYSSLLSSFSIRNILSKRNLGWLLSFVMLSIFFVSTIKRNRANSSLSIKISEDLKEREESLYSQLNRKKDYIGIGLGSNKTKEEKPTSIHKQNYGLRAYENSQKNPLNKGIKTTGISNSARINPLTNNTAITAKRRTIGQKTSTLATKKDVQTVQVQIDSMKFLESMAKIYEKSGRVDLANGLQDNILKAKRLR
ncbi:MAG: hypothetical protein WC197_04580 [Candidatus Gastranaerophilaceae bacterium]|jgi:hypothetical protein